MLRINPDNTEDEFSFWSFISLIGITDLLALVMIFGLTAVVDYALYNADNFIVEQIKIKGLEYWIYSVFFHLRIYVPLILFSTGIYRLVYKSRPALDIKGLAFLFISLWIFNEFAFEVFTFVRNIIFGLAFSLADDERIFLYESFLGIFLVAFMFPGYFSAMTTSIRLIKDRKS